MSETFYPKYVEREDIDLDHANTMVVVTNEAEFSYVKELFIIGGYLPHNLERGQKLPVALSTNSCGWTNEMDRALYYVRFIDYVSFFVKEEK